MDQKQLQLQQNNNNNNNNNNKNNEIILYNQATLHPQKKCFFKTIVIRDYVFPNNIDDDIYNTVVNEIFILSHFLRFNSLYQKVISNLASILRLARQNQQSKLMEDLESVLGSNNPFPKFIQFCENNNMWDIGNLITQIQQIYIQNFQEQPVIKLQGFQSLDLKDYDPYTHAIYGFDDESIFYLYYKSSNDIFQPGGDFGISRIEEEEETKMMTDMLE